MELGNPERGEMWPAPVVSPGYAVKLLLASRVPQHQADLLSIHAGQVDQGDEGDGKLLTILAVRRPRQLDFDKSGTDLILLSRKSTPMVFLYSVVKIPLQYFWISEDFPTAPLPTITTLGRKKKKHALFIYDNTDNDVKDQCTYFYAVQVSWTAQYVTLSLSILSE